MVVGKKGLLALFCQRILAASLSTSAHENHSGSGKLCEVLSSFARCWTEPFFMPCSVAGIKLTAPRHTFTSIQKVCTVSRFHQRGTQASPSRVPDLPMCARAQQALRAPGSIRKKRFQFLPETERRIESAAFWNVKPWRVFAEDHSLARQKQYGSLCH